MTYSIRNLIAGQVLALAGLVVLGSTAIAQDGGTRSPFAAGAGPRALSMGSAFVGVADDASSLMWNAGGLGRVMRRQLQASQASFFGLDITESYAAVVWPDWRWGAVGASLRHFGVSGIERRDERNQLLGDDLSDSQTEIAIGYGRAFGETWSLGGLVKARRQALAGLSGSGFGIDLGMNVRPGALLGTRWPWTQNLSWGMAISNLVEPGIRLVSETVNDPTAMRSGLAYTHELFGGRELIVSVDLEQARMSDMNLRAGMEMQLHPHLALRWGANQGALTAGTGFRWRDLALDYVYEDNPLDAAHRVGLSMSFGHTVRESEELARRVEEDAIQARLADAFQARQDEQIATLLREATEQLEAGEHDTALDALSAIAILQPDNAKARALEISILRSKAAAAEKAGTFTDAAIVYGRILVLAPDDADATSAQQRCEEESGRRAAKSDSLRGLFASAVEELAGDHLVSAREGFRKVLNADRENSEAKRMLDRVEDAIGRRARAHIADAQQQIRAHRFPEAEKLLHEAATLDGRARGLEEARIALAQARQTAARPAPQPTEASRPSRGANVDEPARPNLKPREIEALYRRGLDALREQRSEDAVRYFELVWSADPSHQQVVDHLKREYLMRGMESFSAGRLDQAVELWEKAVRVDPGDARARGYLERARKQLAKTREILGNRP